MAIFKSSVFAEVRGSIAGTTYSRNRYGAYARNRTVPVNPNSNRQLYIRQAMAQAAFNWSNLLAEEDRAAWRQYASTTQVTNRLGDPIYLTGFNMYCRAATFMAYATGSMNDATQAPGSPGLPAPIAFDELNIQSSTSNDPNQIEGVLESPSQVDLTSGIAMFWVSPPLSSGTTFYKGPWLPQSGPLVAINYPQITVPLGTAIGGNDTRFIKWRFMDNTNKVSAESVFGPVGIISPP